MFGKHRRKTRSQLEQEFLELDFTSDFLFSELMKDEGLCRKLIETLLKIKVQKIVYHKTQKQFRHRSDGRGVRFDVYVKSSDRVFDIELQVKNYENLPLRSRYYQANMDLDCLKKKEDYMLLPESYVIFICTGDPFGLGLPVYTVRNFIEEKRDFDYNDRCYKFFYNAKAWKSCNDTEVQGFLKYISTREPSTAFTNEIEARINDAHENPRLKEHFMTLKMKIDEEREEARLEGIALGLAKGITQGAHDKAVETAKILLKKNIDLSVISESTGLSQEELEKLKA
ncbi:Rpn family recombination-promoting nuclease/putative transposase [Treponema sp.]|uniref:Rpn family recombination-promoting nuclease/putative transposase n=1 Tax=Treponema sp. TaxID=166 RepID=UPI00298E8A7E|nr:Rpn family recombination-promoting nuclease/putative transposase [Treponema sp.]MCQ2241405.1 Rpn family recombination-promoting nuclease/putative transposase [Treponema sp.]MCQ2241776.1 Rpn family recombination-promoting nuclease/putative transposase [Treponema sp.]